MAERVVRNQEFLIIYPAFYEIACWIPISGNDQGQFQQTYNKRWNQKDHYQPEHPHTAFAEFRRWGGGLRLFTIRTVFFMGRFWFLHAEPSFFRIFSAIGGPD